MKKLTDKSKRALAVAGIGAVCVALIIGISYRFSAGEIKASGVSLSSSSSPSSKVVVAAVGAGSQNSKSSSSPASSSAAASQAAASSGNTDQKIQPDVSKTSAPSSKPQAQGSTTNPSQKPSYSSKDTTVSKSSVPKNGDKKDGKIYIEGFGWVQNNGGGGSGKTVSGDGDINKQVGQMD